MQSDTERTKHKSINPIIQSYVETRKWDRESRKRNSKNPALPAARYLNLLNPSEYKRFISTATLGTGFDLRLKRTSP
jgi:hypothetical protein